MTAGTRRGSLFYKALLLLCVVTALGAMEVGGALWFRADLMRRFEAITEIDKLEQEYLFGVWTAAELIHDLAVAPDGVVFVRVSEWVGSMSRLNNLQRRLNFSQKTQTPDGAFAENLRRMKLLIETRGTVQEFSDFARGLTGTVNTFSQDLHRELSNLRHARSKMVDDYGMRSDSYAWVLLSIGLTAFVIVVVAAGFFLAHLVRSLQTLQARAMAITNGNYGQPMETKRTDEIGQLIKSLNTMAMALKQQEREASEFRRRLFQQDKAFTLGSFAAGIAHEVGNPIQAIMALTGQVTESLAEDQSEENIEENISRLEMIYEQVERLSGTVTDIREFGHTGAANMEPVDINEVIATTIRLLRFDSRFKKLVVTIALSDDLPVINGAPDHLVQVFLNLLINAADAVDGDQGEIMISTVRQTNQLMVKIADDGHGMTEDALAHATEPFYTTKAKGKGTGLGLAVCKEIIGEHDGRMTIRSAEGEGTAITILFPNHVLDEASAA